MVVSFAERITAGAAAITAAVFSNLSVAIAPVAPSAMFGFAFYDATVATMGHNMALGVGVAAAFSLEGAGFLSFHTALTEKGVWPKTLPAIYLSIGIGALVLIKGGDAVLGVLMFALVALVYASVAFKRGREARVKESDAQRAERLEQERRNWEAEKERQDKLDKQEYELKMARLTAQKEIKLLESSGKVSQNFPAPVESSGKVSETFPRDSRRFRAEHWEKLRGMDEAEIVLMAGVDVKTARAWLKKLEEVTQ
jgi:hypothetical protein